MCAVLSPRLTASCDKNCSIEFGFYDSKCPKNMALPNTLKFAAGAIRTLLVSKITSQVIEPYGVTINQTTAVRLSQPWVPAHSPVCQCDT